MNTRWVLLFVCAFAVAWMFLLPTRLSLPVSTTFSNDAGGYNAGAIHLARSGFYSFDGVTPAVEREPGYSFFLSILYRLFGIENRFAIFLAQGVLHVLATLFFIRQLRAGVSPVATHVAAAFLLLTPSIFHIVFTPYRESFVLSLTLLLAGILLSLRSRPTWLQSVFGGLVFSWLVLARIPFLFLPLIVLVLGCMLPLFPRRMLVPVVLFPVMACVLWGARNKITGGEFRILGSVRLAAVLERRAVQASTFRLQDPILCRWSEYITRDYSTSSPDCGMKYEHASQGREAEKQLIRESKATILRHLPSYAWQSIFYALEMHLPYVNGWGMSYNLLESLFVCVLYLGCLLSLRSIWRREYAFFLAIILYPAFLSSLTEAVPRYHMAGFFGYAVLAGMGYAKLLMWLRNRRS